MASNLVDMLSDLAKDPALMIDFKQNPDSVMNKYGVAEDRKAVIRNAVKNSSQADLLKTLNNVTSAKSVDNDGPEPSFAC